MESLIVAVLIKATLLLLGAGALTVLWRRVAAARRHLVWVLALAGVIALPAAELAVPAWRLPLLPAVATPSEPATVNAVPPAVTRQSTPAPSRSAAATMLVQPSTGNRVTTPSAPAVAPLTWLAIAWLVGAALVLGAFAFGSWRIARLARWADPVTAPDWVRLLAELRADLGVSRPVRLVVAGGPAMPMTWGTRRPVILLPADAALWSESRRRDVLLHELAHVARRDCFTQLIGVCACALYWFHPLAWLAASRLRIERERACDDRVLAAGTKPSAYAELLLDIARELRAGPATALASVAMARPSQLATRLLDVLDPQRRRDGVNRRLATSAGAFAALILPLAALRPAPASTPSVHTPASEQLAAGHLRDLRPRAMRRVATAPTDSEACRPAATGESSSVLSHSSDEENGHHVEVKWVRGHCSLGLVADGTFKLNSDFTDVAQIDAGGSVEVTQSDGTVKRRMDIEPGPSGVTHRYFVDDAERPYDDAAKAWLAATLTDLLRRTGFQAEARSHWILQTRGVDGMFDEIALLSGDYTKRVYYQALAADGKLEPAAVARVVQQAGAELSSSYDLAELLVLVAHQYPLDDQVRVAFVTAANHITSDYDRHRVLAVVLAGRRVPDDLANAILESAAGIASDYDLAEVLVLLIQRHPITPGMSATFFRAVDSIGSDYDRRRVLATLLGQSDPVAPALVAASLKATQHMQSSFDRAEVLVQVADGYGVDETSRTAFFTAADGLSSDYDHARVLIAAVEKPDVTPPIAAAVIASARHMTGDHDRANVLVALATHTRFTPILRRAYLDATREIISGYDRNRALAALGNSEL